MWSAKGVGVSHRRLQPAAFAAGILLFSVYLHMQLGMDDFWDTANYHIFIGWSVLTLQFGEFGALAQYHSYLNPLIDGLNYLFFYAHPYLGAAFHSLCFLAFAWVIFRLARDLVGEGRVGKLLALAGCVLGISGAMTVSLFGSWTNENIVAVPILVGLYVLLGGIRNADARQLFLAGILFGIAAGLKLTAAHYLFGAVLACIIAAPRLRPTLVLLLGMGLGFLLMDGYFMYLRWDLTGNPFFPLANNIFNSPWYPESWKSFSSFDPSRILYYLALPVIWLYSGDFSEATSVRDGRMLLGYLGILLILVDFILSRRVDRQRLALVAFFVCSFLAWILAFRIYRYLVVLEALAAILFVVGLSSVFRGRSGRAPVLVALLALPFLWQVTVYPEWGRRPWSAPFTASNITEQLSGQQSSLVLFADQRLAYLAPELHRAGIGFGNLYSQPWWDGQRGVDGRDPDHSVDPRPLDMASFAQAYFLQYDWTDPRERSAYLRRTYPDQRYECEMITTKNQWVPYLCGFREP